MRVGDFTGARPSAEFARVDWAELPESEVVLNRRVDIGIRDCEFRLEVLVELGEDGGSRSRCGERFVPNILEAGGREGAPEKSLLVLRCMLEGRSGMFPSFLISSSVGVTPRYHADGEEGVIPAPCPSCSQGNIGLGLCMLPSEPLRRRRLVGVP